MAEPNSENLRLATRLAAIAQALSPPAEGGGNVPRALTERNIPGLTKAIAAHVRDTITEMQAPLVARNAMCEQRIVELEAHVIELRQAPTMRYEGVWDAERMYAIGDFVTDDGSLWHCDRSSTGVRPGSMADAWTLAVKRGRDAKGR